MNRAVTYLICALCLWLTPRLVILANGWVQTTNMKVLERDDSLQYPSTEEREKAREEIHQITNSAILHLQTCAVDHLGDALVLST